MHHESPTCIALTLMHPTDWSSATLAVSSTATYVFELPARLGLRATGPAGGVVTIARVQRKQRLMPTMDTQTAQTGGLLASILSEDSFRPAEPRSIEETG